MSLQQIKRRFELALGIVNYNLSDQEIIEIHRQIKEINPPNRSEAVLRKIVTKVTGIDSFHITEALDNSDINDIIDQIEDALK